MNPRDILAAARIKVCSQAHHPYFAPVLFSLRLVEKLGIGTMGVDAGWRLYYDPDFVAGLEPSECAAVLVHETHHVLRDHFGRFPRDTHDQIIANIAGDIELNDDVIASGWTLPVQKFIDADGKEHQAKCLTPDTFGLRDGETAEWYYNELLKQAEKVKPCMGTKGVPGTGGGCGSCAGNPQDYEDGDGPSSGSGDGDQQSKSSDSGVQPISAAEQQVIRQQVAQEVVNHAKQRGTVPAGLQRWAEVQLEPPRVDWRKQLARHVRQGIAEVAGQVNYSYRRVSRRQGAMRQVMERPPVLPAMRRPVVEPALVLDTSGSMGDMEHGDLRTAAAEVLGIVRACGYPCVAYGVDADVAAIGKVSGRRDLKAVTEGGGGTDMGVGIRKAIADGARVVVVLTDGYTPWPDASEMRGRHVLAAITPGGQEPPDHIRHVSIPEAK